MVSTSVIHAQQPVRVSLHNVNERPPCPSPPQWLDMGQDIRCVAGTILHLAYIAEQECGVRALSSVRFHDLLVLHARVWQFSVLGRGDRAALGRAFAQSCLDSATARAHTPLHALRLCDVYGQFQSLTLRGQRWCSATVCSQRSALLALNIFHRLCMYIVCFCLISPHASRALEKLAQSMLPDAYAERGRILLTSCRKAEMTVF